MSERAFHDKVERPFLLRIFGSIIPLSIRAAETSAEGRGIYLHDPAGKVSAAYASLTREVLGS